VQRADAFLQQRKIFGFGRLVCFVIAKLVGNIFYHAETIAHIVDGSAQNCTTLLIEFCELLDGVFEIANAADRFQLLKVSVTRRAFHHAIAAQLC
jgi:hypothetical protein